MKGESVYLVLLLSGIVRCSASAAYNRGDYHDYFKLVALWPPSFCLLLPEGQTCTKRLPDSFIIEGLWPEKKRGEEPQNCPTDCRLKDEDMDPYKDKLLRLWPNLTTTEYDEMKDMWRDQWVTHGSCSAATLLPGQYMKCALDRFQDPNFGGYHLLDMLKDEGVVANGYSYPTKQILWAIKRRTGYAADIVCERDSDNAYTYLKEIHQCLDHSGKNLISCKIGAINCNTDPIFPFF